GLGGDDHIDGLDQLEALSKSPRLRELVGLKVAWPTHPAADRRLATILALAHSGRLESLSIDAADEQRPCFAPETIAPLLQAPWLHHIRDLRISGLSLGDELAKGVAAARFRLRRLSLGSTEISHDEAVVLANSNALSELDELTIGIRAEGAEALAKSPI